MTHEQQKIVENISQADQRINFNAAFDITIAKFSMQSLFCVQSNSFKWKFLNTDDSLVNKQYSSDSFIQTKPILLTWHALIRLSNWCLVHSCPIPECFINMAYWMFKFSWFVVTSSLYQALLEIWHPGHRVVSWFNSPFCSFISTFLLANKAKTQNFYKLPFNFWKLCWANRSSKRLLTWCKWTMLKKQSLQ